MKNLETILQKGIAFESDIPEVYKNSFVHFLKNKKSSKLNCVPFTFETERFYSGMKYVEKFFSLN